MDEDLSRRIIEDIEATLKNVYRLVIKAGDLIARGKAEKALKLIDESIYYLEEPYLYALRGQANYRLGRFKEAESDFTLALKLDPGQFKFLLNRGIVRNVNLKDYEGALEDLQDAYLCSEIKEGDDSVENRYFCLRNLGQVYYILDRFQEALETFQKLVDLKYEPEFLRRDLASVYFVMSRCYLKTKQNEPAYKCLDKASDLAPEMALFGREKLILYNRLYGKLDLQLVEDERGLEFFDTEKCYKA